MKTTGTQGHSQQEWSHVKETINMLYLAVCQIEATMSDSNDSVDTLTESFTKLADHTHDVSQQIQKLEHPHELEAFKEDILSTAAELTDNINASVGAFQFYDRVCQRLDHVARSLEQVSNVMEKEDSLENPNAWKQIQENISASYTMEAERKMFEYIMQGSTVNEALDVYRNLYASQKNIDHRKGDDVELF